RLCLGGVSPRRGAEAGGLRSAGGQGAEADRRTAKPAAARRPLALRNAGGGGDGRHFPHLLHRRAGGTARPSRPADGQASRHACGRCRLRSNGAGDGAPGRLPVCHVHPGRRRADAGEARIHRTKSSSRWSRKMKLSARNVLKGKITDVKKGATTAHIKIDVGGQTVTAAITNEAADELKLAKGQDAYAVIKASDVMVAVD